MDYSKLAAQYGATQETNTPVDYAALAASHGAIQESPPQPQQLQREPTLLERFKRTAALTARAGIEGAGDVVGIVQNPLSTLTGGAIRRSSDVYPQLATSIGLPEPQTGTEKIAGALTRGAAGAATMTGAGSLLSRIPGAIGQLGNVLAAQPTAQLASGMGGAGASEIVKQAGGGQGAQLAAGLAGGLTAGAVPAIAEKIPGLIAGGSQKYIVPPSQTSNPTALARGLETISGKAKTEQFATIKNQQLTNEKVVQDLGFPKETPLSPELLKNYRAQVYEEGYAPITNSSKVTPDAKLHSDLLNIKSSSEKIVNEFPDSPIAQSVVKEGRDLLNAIFPKSEAPIINSQGQQTYPTISKDFSPGTALAKIRELRELASKAYSSGEPSLGKSYKDISSALEDQLGRHLESKGPTMQNELEAFKNARQQMAKSHSVEEALVGGAGDVYNVNAKKLPTQYGGGIGEAAKQARSYPKSMSIPVAGASNPLSLTDIGVGGMYGGSGATLSALTGHNPLLGAALGAAIPIARPIARNIVMSQPYQRELMQQGGTNRLMNLLQGSIGANQ